MKIIFIDQDKTMLGMEKDNLLKSQKEKIIILISMQLDLKKIKEDKHLKNHNDFYKKYFYILIIFC
jgi:hypothetical protein